MLRLKGETKMATKRRHSKAMSKYTASDEIIQWLESVTGLLAHIRSQYGGVPELLEDPDWDPSRSQYAVSLLNGLKNDISRAAKEFSSHVNNY